ncbi:hypothetical protein E2C01_012912 [Portunus trituberculatus]|uniref:Uncharacterized protein n=1 Tax=Portunus trituberculatus TaxID=210409 RepID=A0A5B7DEV6_PORTR|nr:hypothetical protein [Portunus trituberculatus]
MRIAIKDNKRCNIPAVRKRLKTVRGELTRRKPFDSILSNKTVEPSETCEEYSIQGRIRPLYRVKLEGRENWRRHLGTSNFTEAVFSKM